MPWYLYLIECQDGSLYAGITNDLAKRYAAHVSGKGAKYTRSHPPKQLLGWEAYENRSEASKAEYALKQLHVSQKRVYLLQMQTGTLPSATSTKESFSASIEVLPTERITID